MFLIFLVPKRKHGLVVAIDFVIDYLIVRVLLDFERLIKQLCTNAVVAPRFQVEIELPFFCCCFSYCSNQIVLEKNSESNYFL